MAESKRPGYVVLREIGPGRWEIVGEVDRRPGLPARRSRTEAVVDAGGDPRAVHAVLPRSEWRIAREC
jgi:hypothetical protein